MNDEIDETLVIYSILLLFFRPNSCLSYRYYNISLIEHFLILSAPSIYRIQVFHLPIIIPFQRLHPFPNFVSLVGIYYFGTILTFPLYTLPLPQFPLYSTSCKVFYSSENFLSWILFFVDLHFRSRKFEYRLLLVSVFNNIFLPTKVPPLLSNFTVSSRLFLFQVSPPSA